MPIQCLQFEIFTPPPFLGCICPLAFIVPLLPYLCLKMAFHLPSGPSTISPLPETVSRRQCVVPSSDITALCYLVRNVDAQAWISVIHALTPHQRSSPNLTASIRALLSQEATFLHPRKQQAHIVPGQHSFEISSACSPIDRSWDAFVVFQGGHVVLWKACKHNACLDPPH